jgi:signal transduction histidine kinase
MVLALQDSFQKQVALEEERTFIINSVAHDLRTPLFSLRGYLDGLERGIANTPDKITMYVNVCRESAAQLDRLVADLFTFTQMEYTGSDGFEIEGDVVNIVDVVTSSVDSIRIIAEEKEISILVETLSGNTFVHGDTHLLTRVTNNLIDNAVRHTPRGGKITVQSKVTSGKTYVSFRDSGTGFTPEDLLHVFEPLYRGDRSRNLTTGGAGLGLTIAQRIIRRHGGDITVENNSNAGGTVTFWLPVRTVAVT